MRIYKKLSLKLINYLFVSNMTLIFLINEKQNYLQVTITYVLSISPLFQKHGEFTEFDN